MKIGIISDTHDKMHPRVFSTFKDVDAIFHAGDIGREELLIELETIAPVYAVFGNTDGIPILHRCPKARTETIGDIRIFMTHIVDRLTEEAIHELLAGEDSDQAPVDVLIYGHTHEPRITYVGPTLTINPGAAGTRRYGTEPTVAFLEIGPNGALRAWTQALE